MGGRIFARGRTGVGRAPDGLRRWLAYPLAAMLVLTMTQWVVARPAAAAPPVVEEPASEPSGELARPDEAAATVTARMTGRRVKISNLTSETSEFWALPNGAIEVEAHLGPARIKDDSGEWIPVDFTLARQPDGSVAARAHPRRLRLSGQAGAGEHDLAVVSDGQGEVALGWQGALPEPTLDGATATYQEVRPGVDLVVEATRTGFEQFLIVKSRDAVEQVTDVVLPLRGEGLQLAPDGDGGYEIRDSAGQTVGASPAPIMWDAQVDEASGEKLRWTTVGSSTSQRSGNIERSLRPDEEWLLDPATEFPVTIDPRRWLGQHPGNRGVRPPLR